MESIPFHGIELLSFSLARVNRKLVIVTGGYYRGNYQSYTYALEVNAGKWKTLPDLKIPRQYHASCAVKNKVYVIAGKTTGRKLLQTIEMLDMNNQSLMNSWSILKGLQSLLRFYPFVSAVGDKKLLIYGGVDNEQKETSHGTLIDFKRGTQWSVLQNDLQIGSFSHGVSTICGAAVGLAINTNNEVCMVAY